VHSVGVSNCNDLPPWIGVTWSIGRALESMRRFEFWVGGLGLCVVVDRALCLLSFYSFVDLIWSAKKPLVLSFEEKFPNEKFDGTLSASFDALHCCIWQCSVCTLPCSIMDFDVTRSLQTVQPGLEI